MKDVENSEIWLLEGSHFANGSELIRLFLFSFHFSSIFDHFSSFRRL